VAPGVRYPNVYGIDMPTTDELIAHGRTDDEVGAIIGADWIIYQDLEDLIASGTEGNPEVKRFDCSVFNGEYITGDVNQSYLDRIHTLRNDHAKKNTSTDNKKQSVIGIHNNSTS
jgi:amidophosphoribosyltransferase